MQVTVNEQAITDKLAILKKTFDSGKTLDVNWRIQQLKALNQLTGENEQAICDALKKDLNKSASEAFLTEIGFVQAEIKHTLKKLKSWMKPRKVGTPVMAAPGTSFHYPQPLGTVFIMGAWNFPYQLTIAPLVPAIAAGNCALLKPSELAPNVSALIADLLPKYLDTTAFAVEEGGVEVSTFLLAQKFDHIFYTGGETVGKIVMQAAARHLTPVTLELGGKSPCIVDPSCDLKVTARRITWGKWTNSGQICLAPDYLMVHESIKTEFIDVLKETIKEQYGENPKEGDDYGRIVNERHTARLASYLEGHDNIALGGDYDIDGCYMAPTIVFEPNLESPLMQEEIFGPILPVMTYTDHDEVIKFINARPKPLGLYVFSSNEAVQQAYLQKTCSGNLCLNDTMIFMTNPDLGFGGVGTSGMGRYHGKHGFDLFSNLKAVMKRPFVLDAFVRYAPYTDLKMKIIKALQ